MGDNANEVIIKRERIALLIQDDLEKGLIGTGYKNGIISEVEANVEEDYEYDFNIVEIRVKVNKKWYNYDLYD